MQENILPENNRVINKISLWSLLLLVFLLPVMFVPSLVVSVYSVKILLLATAAVLLLVFFLSALLSNGNLEVPKAKFLIPLALFPIIALLSTFFSGFIAPSLYGAAFELGTSGTILLFTLIAFLTVFSIKSRTSVTNKIIKAFLYAVLVTVVYILARAFLLQYLPQSVSSLLPDFIAGNSAESAILLGAGIIISLCTLNMKQVSARVRYLFWALSVFSMLFIGAAGLRPLIILVGLFSLIYFVYLLSWRNESAPNQAGMGNSAPRRFSFSTMFVLIASVVFVLGGTSLGAPLSRILKLNSFEVRPDFQTTAGLVAKSWDQNLFLGVGPNRFAEFWSLHKPPEVSATDFWSVDFSFGYSFIPTMAVTTGILGLASLLAFLCMFVYSGFKAMFATSGGSESRFVSTLSFLVALYLWLVALIYTPGIVTLSFAFIFTGIFAATLVPQGVAQNFRINIFSSPKTNFLGVLGIVVCLLLAISAGYFVWEKSVAGVLFNKGLQANAAGDSAKARDYMVRTVALASSDYYWKSLAENSLVGLSQIVGSVSSPESLGETQRQSIQKAITDSVQSARNAISWNSANYQNWFALGRVYEILSGNGMDGALEGAKGAFTEAAKRAPSNPAIPLALARLDVMSGDTAAAKENIQKAINLKNNYTDAYFTLAQLEAAGNNIPGAIRSVEAAALVDPNNAPLYFQLGLLKYNQRDWRGAASAFERAVNLVPDYANARYFLGLSYSNLGRTADAVTQFEEIKKTNPDNAEVNIILTNLKAGKNPFADAKPPLDDKPEKRPELPVEEN